MNADAAVTFAGNDGPDKKMDGVDYGLQGLDPTPGHSSKPSIRNALAFDLYLNGPAGTDWSGLLAHIEAGPVVISYGSPGSSSVPEPATLAMCLALFGAGLLFRLRSCRAE